MCVAGSPLGSFLEVHGEEEEAAAAENEDKENEETQVVIDKGTLDAIDSSLYYSFVLPSFRGDFAPIPLCNTYNSRIRP